MKKSTSTLYTVAVLFWLALYAYVPFVAPYAESMHASYRLIGLIAGTYGLVQMLIRFPLGILSDKWQKRKLFIQAGLLFATASGLVVFVLPHPVTLLISRSFAGGTAATWVAFTILGASYSNNTMQVIGRLNAAAGVAKVVAFVLGGAIAEWLGVRHAFLVGGLAGLAGLLLSFAMQEKTAAPGKQAPKLSILLGVTRNPQLLCTAVLAIVSQFIQFSTVFGFSPMLATRFGAQAYHLGLLGLVAAIAIVIISPLMNKFARWLGIAPTLVGAFLLAALGCAGLALSQTLWHVFVAQFIIALGASGLMALLMALAIRNIANEIRATAMGFFQAVYGLGMFMGPFIIGWVSQQFTLAAAFILAAMAGLLGATLSVLFCKKRFIKEDDA